MRVSSLLPLRRQENEGNVFVFQIKELPGVLVALVITVHSKVGEMFCELIFRSPKIYSDLKGLQKERSDKGE